MKRSVIFGDAKSKTPA